MHDLFPAGTHPTTLSYRHESGWSTPLPDLDSPRTLVVVFGASDDATLLEPLRDLAEAFPTSHLVGCSTAGEIAGATVLDHSLSVGVVRFEHTRLKTVYAEVAEAGDSYTAGAAIARQLPAADLRGVLILSEGLGVNGSELARGLNDVLPSTVTVTGGLAGDGDRFERTWVLKEGSPHSDVVSAVGIYGDRIQIGHGSKGGWDVFGPERRVTRSQGNVLYELDGRPALEVYKHYLGERASGLPATALLFPLALRSTSSEAESLVRTVLSVDEASQSLTFAGDIPQGHLAGLMKANFDRLVDGASQAARLTFDAPTAGARLCIAISCVGRRLVLGQRTEEELEATLDILPVGTQQIGFYSYGELSPRGFGRCDLHNQTMTLTTLFEE